ncbi:hypothetical protein ECH_1022 [Ehrlichia chaffeensis str. Arkansas]|uniref:Uncharacterized protein n=1 Tax=Ehrlichia chaffeensis (strain ATCC CRL-10679 / Arkansas) TaxID=205920 RepID=Q2GFH5_EHRCR|nr:hypothetical protein ECH_1022 [Ehrlichia chaffeensis str. Arkansas]
MLKNYMKNNNYRYIFTAKNLNYTSNSILFETDVYV